MRTILRFTLGCCLVPFLLPAQSSAERPPTVIRGALAETVDSTLRTLEGNGFSGVVLVAQNGEMILKKGYGLADRAKNRPMTGNTIVPIGSNTKDFTIVAILQLQERGRISLDDLLTKYIPDVPADKRAITLRHLFFHRAGFEQHLGGDYEVIGRSDEIHRALASRLLFAPGADEHYSNIGYSLLAAVIEQVSGKTYDEYVRDEILAPLALEETGLLMPTFDRTRMAHGYDRGEDRGIVLDRALARDGAYWNLRGNGGIQSTVDDMFRFYRELFNGQRLMKPATRALRWEPSSPAMMAGSDMVNFFVYGREPQRGVEFIVYTNSTDFPAPRVQGTLGTALGLGGGRGGPGGGGPQIATTGSRGGGPGGPPATPAGRRLGAFFPAYVNKDTAAYRRFLETNAVLGGDLAAHVADYVKTYERYGFLNRVNVETPTPTRVVVQNRSTMRGPVTLTIDVEPAEPFRITSIRFDESPVSAQQSAPTATTSAPAAPVGVSMPDTPLGRSSAAYLRAYNSGDPSTMRRFIESAVTADPARPLDARVQGYQALFADVGPLTPLSVKDSSRYVLAIVAKSGKTGQPINVIVTVDSTAPAKLKAVQFDVR